MKFKYFLRGVGIGIIFTSIVLLTAYQNRDEETMSKEEIISAAKELGMVEPDPIKDLLDEQKSSEDNSSQEEKKTTAEQTSKEQTEEVTSETKEETPTTEEKTDKTTEKTTEEKTDKTTEATTEEKTEKTTEATTEKTTEEKPSKGEKVTLVVRAGESSYPICQRLQSLGLIEDAAQFDNYLIKYGYASRICVGTHVLKIGMSYHEIAEILVTEKP